MSQDQEKEKEFATPKWTNFLRWGKRKCCYMMATKAFHGLMGDINLEKPELCYIEGEDGDNFVGQWVEGYGFLAVRFPKETTRALTQKERDYYNSRYLQLGDIIIGKLDIDQNND